MDRAVPAVDQVVVEVEISAATCARAGSLACYGLSDRAIANSLLITIEQVAAIKATEPFKKAFSEKAQERQQRLMDLEDGWDTVEEKALAHVLQNLEYNCDPRYALLAARTANSATRRSPSAGGRAIDATRAGNVIVLSLNQNFINRTAVSPNAAVLDISPVQDDAAKRRVDLPTPKRVSEILQVGKTLRGGNLSEIDQACAEAGVDPSMFVDE